MFLNRKIGISLLHFIPKYNQLLYRICRHYVDQYNSDNNCDSTTNGEYEYLKQILPQLDKNSIVFDVGANVGDWATLALTLNPDISLHCFEPSISTYQKLSNKTWPANVYLNNEGLGNVEETKTFYLVDGISEMNSLYSGVGIAQIATQTELVKITTIDDYCFKMGVELISFLKIDVEGHELSVFKGMKSMLGKHAVRCIQFEYGGAYLDAKTSLCDIYDFLAPYKFNIYKIYPKGLRHISRYDRKLDTFKYSNWIALHQDFEDVFITNIDCNFIT